MKVPYTLTHDEYRALAFSHVEQRVKQHIGKHFDLSPDDERWLKSIRRADRFGALLDKSEFFALFIRHAEMDCERWHDGMQVSLGPDDAALVEGLRQRPENAMLTHAVAERR
jgi:hypothetical protein